MTRRGEQPAPRATLSRLAGRPRRTARTRLAKPAPLACLALLGALALATTTRAQTTLFQVSGDTPGEGFGFAVGRAGDVDGDGRSDVIAGALFDVTSSVMSGSAWVFSGLDGHTIRVWHGVEQRQEFGFAVDGDGDADGDGVADLVVGSPGKDGTAMNTGQVEVFSGATGALLHSFAGDDLLDELGFACAMAGDVDADGFTDIAGGARWDDDGGTDAGSVRIWSGADGSLLHEVHGTNAFDRLGWAVAGAGDTNLDGRADVIAGAPYHATGGIDAGRAIVISGLDGSVLLVIDGDAGDLLGLSVEGLGDVDGDGRGDLAAGRPGSDAAGIDSGRVTIHAGLQGSILVDLAGDAPMAAFGFSLGDAGDIDGNGIPDLVAGAPGDLVLGGPAGSAEIVSGETGITLGKLHGTAAGDLFAWSVAGAGDADGDGLTDVVAGAPGASTAGVSAGTVTATAGAGICPGMATGYGTSLAGSGGIAPSIRAAGCPTPGAALSATIFRGLGGAPGALLLGTSPGAFPLLGGTIWMLPLVSLPVQLGGEAGVAGAGNLSLPLLLPNNPLLSGSSFFLQALVLDPGAPQGLSMSRGLSLRLG